MGATSQSAGDAGAGRRAQESTPTRRPEPTHLRAVASPGGAAPPRGFAAWRDDADELLDELVLALACRCDVLVVEEVEDTRVRGREASLVCLRCGRRWVRSLS